MYGVSTLSIWKPDSKLTGHKTKEIIAMATVEPGISAKHNQLQKL